MCSRCIQKTLEEFMALARDNLNENGCLKLTLPSVYFCSNTPQFALNLRPRISGRMLQFPGKSFAASQSVVIILRVISLILENMEFQVNITTRDIYYQDVELFKTQGRVARAIEYICAKMGVPRSLLNIIPAQRGLIVADLTIILQDPQQENKPVTTIYRSSGPSLIPVGREIQDIIHSNPSNMPKYILIVEKEGVFTHLHSVLTEAIIITGKGFPDHYTRKFLHSLYRKFPNLPIYGLVDSDVHGIQILRTYQDSGNNTLEFHYPVHSIQFLGVSILDYNDGWVDITSRERKLIMCMFKKDWILDQKHTTWKAEIQRQIFMGKKAEMNILDRNHLTRLVDYVRARVSLATSERPRALRAIENIDHVNFKHHGKASKPKSMQSSQSSLRQSARLKVNRQLANA